LWRKARRENSAASRLLGSTSLRFALHGWQRWNLLFFISGSGGGRLLSNAAHAICRLHLKRNKASAAARWRQRAGRLYVRGL
ncbi:hypothetical protein, partial [Thiolapillus sp.]|uniref:hypothetical protein n=1 Tax=Thiolapillus sp. TaxID=2017437 RepID=UPI0025FD7A50